MSDAMADIERSWGFELVADLGNGVQLEVYYPEHADDPTWWLRQNGHPAPLKRHQLVMLRDTINVILGDMFGASDAAG